VAVVARVHGHVHHLLVGVLAGLARLHLDDVEELAVPVEGHVVGLEDDLGTLLDRPLGPLGLGLAGALERLPHVGLLAGRERPDPVAGERLGHLEGLGHAVGQGDVPAQPLDALVLLGGVDVELARPFADSHVLDTGPGSP
jgi:hypothetical protein